MIFRNKNELKIFSLRLFLFIVSFIWFTGLISPCINNNSIHSIYPYLNFIYGTVCHQESAKTFSCNGTTFLVCARCSGIYLSVLIISFLTLFSINRFQIKTKYLIYFSLPMLFDVILYSIGLYNYNKIISAVSGFLFGSAVFLYILEAIENSLCKKSY